MLEEWNQLLSSVGVHNLRPRDPLNEPTALLFVLCSDAAMGAVEAWNRVHPRVIDHGAFWKCASVYRDKVKLEANA